MPDIFGEDIAGIINEELGDLVFDVTLTKVTPGTRGADETAGTNPTESSSTCKGFVDEYKDREINGTTVLVGDRKIVILGDSLPSGTVPKPGDKITAESVTRTIVKGGVKRDPAGATYTCQCR